jgi:hypothetical protein
MIAPDKAEELAVEWARVEWARVTTAGQDTDIDVGARLVAPPEIPGVLQQHRVVEITVHDTLPPRVVFVAVAGDGQVWEMPGEFNAVIATERLTISEQEQALAIIELYLQLIRQEQVLLLRGAADIPFEDGYWTDPQQFEDTVYPPKIVEVDEGYRLDFYSWSELGGLLERWHCVVTHRGEVIIDETTPIANLVGDAVVVQ